MSGTQVIEQPPQVFISHGNNGEVKNLSTVSVFRTRGMVPASVMQVWGALITPMNHRYASVIQTGKAADEALNGGVEFVLSDKNVANFKYILFMDDDNLPPVDGLLTLLETISDYDGISGLYVTKTQPHWPLILGDPKDLNDYTPRSYSSGIHECNAMGMGFVLIKIDVFRQMEPPWFKMIERPVPGIRRMQEDIFFFRQARANGFRFAVNAGVKVGHLDTQNGMVYYPPEQKGA